MGKSKTNNINMQKSSEFPAMVTDCSFHWYLIFSSINGSVGDSPGASSTTDIPLETWHAGFESGQDISPPGPRFWSSIQLEVIFHLSCIVISRTHVLFLMGFTKFHPIEVAGLFFEKMDLDFIRQSMNLDLITGVFTFQHME